MSDYSAIAAVTATIRDLLSLIKKDIIGVDITVKPPDVIEAERPSDILNIFLYQITPNNGYSNMDLPRRNQTGGPVVKPLLALNLHYLLTAYASDNDELQAQKILSKAMMILHENPLLTRDMIRKALQAETKVTGLDLAEQAELIKITPQSLSLEELTKLWSSFFHTNYRISVAYQATVVLL